MISRKWPARSRPLWTRVGFPINWTTAISSMITTLLPACWRCSSSSSKIWLGNVLSSLLLPTQCEGDHQNWTALWEMQLTPIHWCSPWDQFQVWKEPRRENVRTKPCRPLEQQHQMLFYPSFPLLWSSKCEGLLSSLDSKLSLHLTIFCFTKLLKRSWPSELLLLLPA